MGNVGGFFFANSDHALYCRNISLYADFSGFNAVIHLDAVP
nr:hypothetical protein [Proteus terrae subsp. cibarius]